MIKNQAILHQKNKFKISNNSQNQQEIVER